MQIADLLLLPEVVHATTGKPLSFDMAVVILRSFSNGSEFETWQTSPEEQNSADITETIPFSSCFQVIIGIPDNGSIDNAGLVSLEGVSRKDSTSNSRVNWGATRYRWIVRDSAGPVSNATKTSAASAAAIGWVSSNDVFAIGVSGINELEGVPCTYSMSNPPVAFCAVQKI